MENRKIVGTVLTLVLLVMLYTTSGMRLVTGWSNGGFSSDPNNPNYGTHDWIAQHALDWLPDNEKEYIRANLAAYLYGTEMPDRSPPEGYGDTVLHHIYYRSNGSMQDDASAIRAQEQYEWALTYVNEYGNISGGVLMLGTMSHYIVDVGVFGHVMGSGTDWGPEQHHEDYETYVQERTNSYDDEFNVYLAFDGDLSLTTAYDAACALAGDTTFDMEGDSTCVWMDENYNWDNTDFRDRCGESLNLCVNLLADVLHTFYMQTMHESTRYPWPMFHHDLRHIGYSESLAPNTNKILWAYTTGSRVFSSPAVADGKVYIGSEDWRVYCLDASTGAYIWGYPTEGSVYYSSPAVADGKVYIGSDDQNVYCLDAFTGGFIWKYTTGGGVWSSPAVVDGRVYVGSNDYQVYCLDASYGAYIWSYPTGSAVVSSPAVACGKVYVGSYDNRVYCLNASTGECLWGYATGDDVGSSPAVAYDKVYVGSWDNKIYCLSAVTGEHIWNYTTGNHIWSSPAVFDSRVYIGSVDSNVYCLDAATGAHIWDYTIGYVMSSPAVADGKIYVGSSLGEVYCLAASDGAYIWSYLTEGSVYSCPAVADGVVFVGSFDAAVYAFGDVIRYPEDGHLTLQDAIDDANPGATISIALGTYHESIVLNKPLTILGRKGSAPIFDGGGSGIYATLLPSASGSVIAGIVITNWDQGILIADASACKIYDNIMSLNDYDGIALVGSSAVNNLIYNNIFQENTIAINITQYSTNNIIYHNSFLNNPTQVHISQPTENIWDDGYPSGGNYWSTLASKDLYKGANQNEPGSDGINDTRCTIATNNVDRYPLTKPYAGQHDIGITDVVKSKAVIGQGFTLSIEIKILNFGMYTEAFDVTAYADSLVIATQTINLASRNPIFIIFTWSTTGVVKDNYTISLIADTVPDETFAADNIFIDGWVVVTVIGDINGDFKVDITDLVLVIKYFGSYPGHPTRPWNPNADINCDGKVDIQDLVLLIKHFGEHYP